jgi:tetratricopeptide (TPR) repeat protein
LIHSLSDFGQHLPANAFLSVIFCALLVSLARQKRKEISTTIKIGPARKFRVWRGVALVCVCGIWSWALIGANNARIAQSHWKQALQIEKGLIDKQWQGTEGEYADLLSHAAAASDYEPENIKYRYWVNVYRWYSITKATDSETENAIISQASMPLARDIVSDLNKALIICPTYGPSYSLAGQIEKFVFYDDAGSEKIRKGYQLAPCDPTACFVAGTLDVLEGRTEESVEKFEKAVTINGGLFKDVVSMYITHLSRPRLAISAAGDDIWRLRFVARALDDMQYDDLSSQCRQSAKELLETRCSQPGASAGSFVSLAGVYREQEANDEAIACYRRALAMDYGQVHWRYAMAKLLADTGRIQEALEEARICVRLRPQFEQAENLVAELSVNPASFDYKTN